MPSCSWFRATYPTRCDGSLAGVINDLKMKIGILTLRLGKNFGGVLQAYALQTVLERMGHQVEVMKWKQPEFKGFPMYKAPFIYAKRLFNGKEIFREYREQRESRIVFQNLQESVNRLIHYTEQTIDNWQSLIDYCNKARFDVLIVGSDQVWRKSYGDTSFFNKLFPKKTLPNLKTFYLDFVEDLNPKPRCISYAASFGVDYAEYNRKEIETLGSFLRVFDKVSVREESGIGLIRDVYKWRDDVQQVLDPTLLLIKEDYIRLLNIPSTKTEPYLFYYVLDDSEQKKELLSKLSNQLSLPVKSIIPYSKEGKVEDWGLPSVEEWVASFANADSVLTDSFHGMVFSIIFNKPFWVIGNSKRGNARFESLLGQYGLEGRMIAPGGAIDWNKAIDWERVNEIREGEKDRCLGLLKETLK